MSGMDFRAAPLIGCPVRRMVLISGSIGGLSSVAPACTTAILWASVLHVQHRETENLVAKALHRSSRPCDRSAAHGTPTRPRNISLDSTDILFGHAPHFGRPEYRCCTLPSMHSNHVEIMDERAMQRSTVALRRFGVLDVLKDIVQHTDHAVLGPCRHSAASGL
jgi:hypothetical protein